MAVFTLVGLAVGHVLGGPQPEDRVVLALATATRHPGVALAIVSANFPGAKAILAAVLLSMFANVLVTIPYLMWHKRRHTGARAL